MSAADRKHQKPDSWINRIRDWFLVNPAMMHFVNHYEPRNIRSNALPPELEDIETHVVSLAELSKHSCVASEPVDCWIAVDKVVYDVSRFARHHPGGPQFLYRYAGCEVPSHIFHRHHPASLTAPFLAIATEAVGVLPDYQLSSKTLSASPPDVGTSPLESRRFSRNTK